MEVADGWKMARVSYTFARQKDKLKRKSVGERSSKWPDGEMPWWWKNLTNSLKASSSRTDQDNGNLRRKRKEKKRSPKIHPGTTHFHSDDNRRKPQDSFEVWKELTGHTVYHRKWKKENRYLIKSSEKSPMRQSTEIENLRIEINKDC